MFRLMENRLATMQMATTMRLILQTIKSTSFGFSILIFFIIYVNIFVTCCKYLIDVK
ncbi:hypothetical protein Taro_000364 [Colocasia esculenta]|uniref:Uncharacterized protein n=1 Tax=Colocasia esculenta TaxID=4460 RepID=A0A843TAK9_COLES|nr:hypothetical protein [Colocasia esculenta]